MPIPLNREIFKFPIENLEFIQEAKIKLKVDDQSYDCDIEKLQKRDLLECGQSFVIQSVVLLE